MTLTSHHFTDVQGYLNHAQWHIINFYLHNDLWTRTSTPSWWTLLAGRPEWFVVCRLQPSQIGQGDRRWERPAAIIPETIASFRQFSFTHSRSANTPHQSGWRWKSAGDILLGGPSFLFTCLLWSVGGRRPYQCDFIEVTWGLSSLVCIPLLSPPHWPSLLLFLGVHRLHDRGRSGDEWSGFLQLLLAAVEFDRQESSGRPHVFSCNFVKEASL